MAEVWVGLEYHAIADDEEYRHVTGIDNYQNRDAVIIQANEADGDTGHFGLA